jgi:hypothetical protein
MRQVCAFCVRVRQQKVGNRVTDPQHAKNVKRWRDGQIALRWCAAGMVEASSQFRRVNGHLRLHLRLAAFRAALDRLSPPKLSAPTARLET